MSYKEANFLGSPHLKKVTGNIYRIPGSDLRYVPCGVMGSHGGIKSIFFECSGTSLRAISVPEALRLMPYQARLHFIFNFDIIESKSNGSI